MTTFLYIHPISDFGYVNITEIKNLQYITLIDSLLIALNEQQKNQGHRPIIDIFTMDALVSMCIECHVDIDTLPNHVLERLCSELRLYSIALITHIDDLVERHKTNPILCRTQLNNCIAFLI